MANRLRKVGEATSNLTRLYCLNDTKQFLTSMETSQKKYNLAAIPKEKSEEKLVRSEGEKKETKQRTLNIEDITKRMFGFPQSTDKLIVIGGIFFCYLFNFLSIGSSCEI